VRAEAAPNALSVGGSPLAKLADRAAFDAASSGWFYELPARAVWAKIPAASGPVEVSFQ
jgi:hypothetical protein